MKMMYLIQKQRQENYTRPGKGFWLFVRVRRARFKMTENLLVSTFPTSNQIVFSNTADPLSPSGYTCFFFFFLFFFFFIALFNSFL
jgi:hypothetical protein